MTAFATATDWRWPPERPATFWRGELIVVTDSSWSVLRARASIVGSSSRCRPIQLLAAEEHVLDHVAVVGQGEVLVDDLDAQPGRVLRAVDLHRAALEQDLAVVDRVDAGDALDQGRLARAVVPDEGHHLAGGDVEVDLVQGLDRAEALRDPAQLQKRRFAHLSSPSSFVPRPGAPAGAPGEADVRATDRAPRTWPPGRRRRCPPSSGSPARRSTRRCCPW